MLLLGRFRAGLAVFFIALTAACGGGGGGNGAPSVPVTEPTSAPSTATPNATPTLTPTAAPTATPTPAPIIATPSNAFDFYAVGNAYAQTVALSQAGYAGAFTAGAQCAGVVTISAISNTQFAIVPIAPGQCALYFSNSVGDQSGPIYIDVTTTQVVGT
ncbi:MAG TPA: hypothetical protein VNF68_01150 [Candidatus Baltobacteraceae bacterium]|nr:hypothetical protein [Candidatus Baltobacteraceae bacterium]